MNALSRSIDEMEDAVPPQPKFKDYDNLKNGNVQEKQLWTKWNKLEQENKELFRLA